MSAIKLSTPSSGSISLSPADTASNLTITVPAVTGTMNLVGPAFSAYQSSPQTGMSAGTFTKVTFDTEEFDTNNNFASSRFTPTVAGYYQISGGVNTGGAGEIMVVEAYKNGSSNKRFGNSNTAANSQISGSALIYFNGSTDYVEMYVYQASSTTTDATNQGRTWFTGVMVRGA
jgi:hypothetical protein